ncbi:uncharacterized protein BJ212DRAFT_1262287 [Suillus subaureus]|uniref:BTB domain-containing protein n=1 Tax=Suillus subaureus TaxID=48587 RepID=A0A9P7EKK6_9AGAM|nr:uncharacterized protein BJ212DRAFT_1262287 [Suillus subaureus]KAG1823743.1 hypothetical protein BJ212DRAFT_1262287 [Suillus subaureus]
MFAAMESAGLEEIDGKSDERPIHLASTTWEMFELFLEHTFGRSCASQYTLEELSNFLHFCDMYQCSHMWKFVVSHIQSTQYHFHPAQLINLAIQYNMGAIFPFAFKQLVNTPITQLTAQHQQLLGNDVFTSLVYVQAALEEHHCIVAAEEPKILIHTSNCQDPVSYNKDWHTIWWNSMACFLLNGQNPQPYHEAVKCFKDLQFGRVSGGCKELMFKIIEQGATFNHAEQFVKEACDCLTEKLISDSSL